VEHLLGACVVCKARREVGEKSADGPCLLTAHSLSHPCRSVGKRLLLSPGEVSWGFTHGRPFSPGPLALGVLLHPIFYGPEYGLLTQLSSPSGAPAQKMTLSSTHSDTMVLLATSIRFGVNHLLFSGKL